MDSAEIESQVKLDNNGNVYTRNRTARRQRPITDNRFTKLTHAMKKIRSKNVKRNQQRQRKFARISKVNQEIV